MLVDVAGWRSSPNSSTSAWVSVVWIVTLNSDWVKLKILNCETLSNVSVNQWFTVILSSHWVEHNINLPIAGLPGTRALCDALVHVLPLVKIDHLWIETMHKITQNWNYQIETETCSRQRRLEVFTIFTFSKLAVERETVSIRGTGKVLKVPVESTFL